jgi:DNA polymerase-3 subunit delta
MSPDELEAELSAGKLRPLYLLVGQERLLIDQAIGSLKPRALAGGIAGLNEDTFTAGQDSVERVLATARTLPMLAPRRWLLVRALEKWDSAKDGEAERPRGGKGKAGPSARAPLDQLVDYASAPAESAVLVLTAEKLDKRRKLYTGAKADGSLVSCEPPARREVPSWVVERVRARGCTISRAEAELLSELLGGELSALADAVERLCLYVGSGQRVTEEAIEECTVRVKTRTVWELVSAVGSRNAARALEVLDDVYDASDRFRLLSVLGWATRQLLRFDAARRAGMSASDAARAAGAPPFKATELDAQLRAMPEGALERWLQQLAEADLALKGGSRRPPRAVVERMLLDLCQSS